jgi:hypothetical protein
MTVRALLGFLTPAPRRRRRVRSHGTPSTSAAASLLSQDDVEHLLGTIAHLAERLDELESAHAATAPAVGPRNTSAIVALCAALGVEAVADGRNWLGVGPPPDELLAAHWRYIDEIESTAEPRCTTA